MTEQQSIDKFLRAWRFQIFGRPKRGEAWWVRRGVCFKQSDALRVAERELKEWGQTYEAIAEEAAVRARR